MFVLFTRNLYLCPSITNNKFHIFFKRFWPLTNKTWRQKLSLLIKRNLRSKICKIILGRLTRTRAQTWTQTLPKTAASSASRVQQDPRLQRYAKKRPLATVEAPKQPTLETQVQNNHRPCDLRRKNSSISTLSNPFELSTEAYNPKNQRTSLEFQWRMENNFDSSSYQNRRNRVTQEDKYEQVLEFLS